MRFRRLVPPAFLRRPRRATIAEESPVASAATGDATPDEPLSLRGDYPDWASAAADSVGYDAANILDATREALLKVKRGAAVHERDSVLFDTIEYAWPVLAGLLWAAARSGGRLDVLDFGGSLGTTYYQNRLFLDRLGDVRWNIVEQPGHVAEGRRSFQDDRLRFFERIEDCWAETRPNVTLVSASLQVVERPHETLDRLLSFPCDHLVLDRIPLWEGPRDRLCVEHVPSEIYAGSYPTWIFSKRRLDERLASDWTIVAEFESLDAFPAPVPTRWRGLCAIRTAARS